MKKYKRLTFYERCKIQVMDEQGCEQKDMAKALGRAASTISREIKRNKTPRRTRVRGWFYQGDYAQDNADMRKKNKVHFVKFTTEVELFIREKINLKWSPEQIAGYATVNDMACVSHE